MSGIELLILMIVVILVCVVVPFRLVKVMKKTEQEGANNDN
jgi:type II secretory pathway pseudopilin PulG